MSHPIRSIAVIGGGAAGWMAAAALASRFNGHQRITLVESEEIGAVGVGEATIPPILNFIKLLGVDEDVFVRATQATFKLGIRFQGWDRIGGDYLHPFGRFGVDFEEVQFHQHWMRLRASGRGRELSDYCLSAVAARKGSFFRTVPDRKNILSTLGYAFHFDAALYARFLRSHAEERGVSRIEGRVVSVERWPETGFIQGVTLASGERVEADLFIDCTGFRALLIEETLEAGFEDWSHWLPCNRAIAVPSATQSEPTPYTTATARKAGWQWRIPLQSRIGNGYVYCSEFINEDEAVATLLSNLDGEALAEPRALRFVAGRRRKAWVKNCIALGLAGGFLEPLESTSIHMIQSALIRLLALFPDRQYSPVQISEYNRQTEIEYARIRDFIILHYHVTKRDDAPLWDHVRQMKIPESLASRLELFRAGGRFFREGNELFDLPNWLAVLVGQGMLPDRWDPMADTVALNVVSERMERLAMMIDSAASAMPSHQAFIDRYCRA